MADMVFDYKNFGLIGSEESSVDAKGRVLLSKKKKANLGDNFVLSLGPLGNIIVTPKSVWQAELDELMSYPRINPGFRQVAGILMDLVFEDVNCDEQGRFVIPAKLRERANIDKNVTIKGMIDRLEIWADEEYKNYNDPGYQFDKSREKQLIEGYKLMKES